MNKLFTKESCFPVSISIATIITASFVLFLACSSDKNSNNQTDKVKSDSISTTDIVSDSNSTSLSSRVITIKNVQNNEQIHEILTIIENYSKEHEMKNLKIECFRDTNAVLK